ncbi:MAG TPA: UDP-N-acetylmuramoyl-tripeptide--D-alanyl-D-alanine ligase [Thermodesulfobacteriota bacterium]|nr:UDP-N-acetylmuramoyl-tripeptide--D-alanyl-D-alanine ligase [Thermodesulfobacteriota bacterium]
MELAIKDLIIATGGRLLRGSGESVIRSVSIDSRSVKKGDFFFAIKGERFDGHDFLKEVYASGAAGAIVEERRASGVLAGAGEEFIVIAVPDTLKALGDAAGFWRKATKVLLIAISGSSGKTTTKDMAAAILEKKMSVLKTRGNMNNLIGLPLTLFSVEKTHLAVVAELGVSVEGEMSRLASIARPDAAVITNIGRAHLEGFKDMEGVATEKLKLFEAIKADGTIAINMDDPILSVAAKRYAARKITFGRAEGTDVRIKEVAARGLGVRVDYEVWGKTLTIDFDSPSVVNAWNGAAAISATLPFGATPDDIKEGLGDFRQPSGRMKVLSIGTWTVIDDTYNANPDSVAVALKSLSLMKGRRVAVLGEMFELGAGKGALHKEAGAEAARLGIDVVVAIGKSGAFTKEGALEQGMKEKDVHFFETNAGAMEKLRFILKDKDVALVKGSRSARTEEITEGLAALVKNKKG